MNTSFPSVDMFWDDPYKDCLFKLICSNHSTHPKSVTVVGMNEMAILGDRSRWRNAPRGKQTVTIFKLVFPVGKQTVTLFKLVFPVGDEETH